MSARVRRYSRWTGIISGSLTFAIVALFMAVLSIPGQGYYLGDSSTDIALYFGLALIWAAIFGALVGGAGWLVGGVIATFIDRSKAQGAQSLSPGTRELAQRRESKPALDVEPR